MQTALEKTSSAASTGEMRREVTPKSTPSNENTYHYFANIFKNIARQLGKSVTDLDLEIWKQYSKTV